MKRYFGKIGLGAVLGGLLGYAYYYFIGCNGSCAIASSPYISTAYGGLVGILVMFPSKMNNKNDESSETN
jgi:hypothetical protein